MEAAQLRARDHPWHRACASSLRTPRPLRSRAPSSPSCCSSCRWHLAKRSPTTRTRTRPRSATRSSLCTSSGASRFSSPAVARVHGLRRRKGASITRAGSSPLMLPATTRTRPSHSAAAWWPPSSKATRAAARASRPWFARSCASCRPPCTCASRPNGAAPAATRRRCCRGTGGARATTRTARRGRAAAVRAGRRRRAPKSRGRSPA